MDDPQMPITLRAKPVTQLLVLAVAALLFWYGTQLIGDDGTTRVPIIGSVPAVYVGWPVLALGLFLGIAFVQSLVTGRPSLVLDAEGLTYAPNFGAVRKIAWAEINAIIPFSSRRWQGVRVMVGDKSVTIPAFSGTGDDLHDLMRRCATAGRGGKAGG